MVDVLQSDYQLTGVELGEDLGELPTLSQMTVQLPSLDEFHYLEHFHLVAEYLMDFGHEGEFTLEILFVTGIEPEIILLQLLPIQLFHNIVSSCLGVEHQEHVASFALAQQLDEVEVHETDIEGFLVMGEDLLGV